jgi:DNA mismatch endonuclease (patch repair protein)
MRRIRSKGMKPELVVRRMAHAMGFRYRLHVVSLPGKPDLVFPGRKKVIFVHGCFWHGHTEPRCVDGNRRPRSNLDYWLPKLEGNQRRDKLHMQALAAMGWTVLIIWECEIKNVEGLKTRLRQFLA